MWPAGRITAVTTNTRPAVWWSQSTGYHGLHALAKRSHSFPVSRALAGTFRRLSRFCNILPQDLTPLYVKITRSTNLLSVCRRKLKLSTSLHTVSYNHILSFLDTRSQLVWVLGRSGFYSITWRMISRSAGYKIHFRKQPSFRRNFFSLVWYLHLSFLWISTPWQFVYGSHVFVQLNKTFTQTMRECFGYLTELAENSLF